jgi:hypothetical protein
MSLTHVRGIAPCILSWIVEEVENRQPAVDASEHANYDLT